MLMLTSVVATLVFPSILIACPLPGRQFDAILDMHSHGKEIAWQGVINIGIFMFSNGVGTIFSVGGYCKAEKTNPSGRDEAEKSNLLSKDKGEGDPMYPKFFIAGLFILQILCTVLIYALIIWRDFLNVFASFTPISIAIAAFSHGLISSH